MVEILSGFPPHVAAFKASGKINGTDYDSVINPTVAKTYKENGKLNYFLQLDTPLSNFSAEAWFKDALVGFVYLTEMKKVAIVSSNKNIRKFTNLFGKLLPGSYRGFTLAEFDQAKDWISE